MLPQKNFGFVFFQRYYDKAVMPLYVEAEKKYYIERTKEATLYFKTEFKNKWDTNVDSMKEKFKSVAEAWRNRYIKLWERAYDKQHKDARIDEIIDKKEVTEQQMMPDLHATFGDAKRMYNFLANIICNELQEITVMCDERDFYRTFDKPKYAGDFIRHMFEWNYKTEA